MILSYTRVSTDEQAADGTTSLAEQERKNRAVAQLRGAGTFDVINYVDAGVSGTIPLGERPAGQKMLAEAAKGDCIVAAKLDRLFRSASDALSTAEQLRKRGIDIILIDMGVEPVTGNGTAKIFFGLLALVAEFERDRIAERMSDGRRGKRAHGGHVGGPPPYGYQVVGEGREARLRKVPREQEVVILIQELKRNGAPCAEMVRELDRRELRTRTGQPFAHEQVKRIVNRLSMQ